MYKRLPEELKQRGRFCLWKYEMRKGQQTKVPYRTSGEKANLGDSNTFTDFKSAQTAYLQGGYNGIGLGILSARKPL